MSHGLKLGELTPKVRGKVVETFRYTDVEVDEWYDCVYEDVKNIAPLLGIDLISKDGRPLIFFSGFCSQGDGASFRGDYKPRATAIEDITQHAPEDTTLIEIARELTAFQITMRVQYGAEVEARIYTRDWKYSHSMTMGIEHINFVGADCNPFVDEAQPTAAEEQTLLSLMRRFADWIYKSLENEHDYLTSDEAVAESLADLLFDEDGAVI